VKVYCRIRPAGPNDKDESGVTSKEVWDILEDGEGGMTCCTIQDDKGPKKFNLDWFFAPSASQEEVYNRSVKVLVDQVLNGFNATIFAYGQTGSGKTWSMTGDPKSEVNMGMVPRMVNDLFLGEGPEVNLTVRLSFVEIYRDKIKDLFDPSQTNLKIRETRKACYIEAATEHCVGSPEDLLGLIEQGNVNRSTGRTNMNAHSSRSHSVIILKVSTVNKNGVKKDSQLMMVDLAGSEKQKKTGASGQRLDEAKSINSSLSALRGVVSAITQGRKHVGYRDNKLTRVLSPALGGNSKTCILVAASPCEINAPETVNTLQFAVDCKKVKNKVKQNKTLSLEQYKVKVAQIEGQLSKYKFIVSELKKIGCDHIEAVEQAAKLAKQALKGAVAERAAKVNAAALTKCTNGGGVRPGEAARVENDHADQNGRRETRVEGQPLDQNNPLSRGNEAVATGFGPERGENGVLANGGMGFAPENDGSVAGADNNNCVENGRALGVAAGSHLNVGCGGHAHVDNNVAQALEGVHHPGHSHHDHNSSRENLFSLLDNSDEIDQLNQKIVDLTGMYEHALYEKEKAENEAADLREEFEDKLQIAEETRKVINESANENERKCKEMEAKLQDALLYKTKAAMLENENQIRSLEYESDITELKRMLKSTQGKMEELMLVKSTKNPNEQLPLTDEQKSTMAKFSPLTNFMGLFKKSVENSKDKETTQAEFDKWKAQFDDKYEKLHAQLLVEVQANRELRCELMVNSMSKPSGEAGGAPITPRSANNPRRRQSKKMLTGMLTKQKMVSRALEDEREAHMKTKRRLEMAEQRIKYDQALKQQYSAQMAEIEDNMRTSAGISETANKKLMAEIEMKDNELAQLKAYISTLTKKMYRGTISVKRGRRASVKKKLPLTGNEQSSMISA